MENFIFPQFPADLVTFTEEILNGKLHFFCAVSKFEILLVKIFSVKQNPNKILTATIEKIKFYVSMKTVSFSSRLLVLCKR